ncbi:(2Fe-2S)-binding protein [Candidatus Poribacteria bacterium]|nr:(2Fe-2S)-binding protein [Candidatus Poribacteria bacterium]
MAVTHCICKKTSIADMLEWAKEHNAKNVEAITKALGCGGYCGMCRPYICYALATGLCKVPYPCPALPKNRRGPVKA